MEIKFNTITEAIEDINAGKMIIVVDDENRENEGDFVMAAEHSTPDKINFMVKYGRGLICTPLSKSKAEKLNLPLMVAHNDSNHETAFTVSIDAKLGITTGISSADRSRTIELLADTQCIAADFVRPGHMFPLIAKDGGVMTRPGHTEAAVDLCKLAGTEETGVICEILNDDGTMARVPDLIAIAAEHDLKIITIEDLIFYKKNQIIINALESNPVALHGGLQ